MSSFFFIPTFWHHSFLWFCAVGTVWTHNMLIQKIGWWNPSLQMFQYGHYWATLLLYMFMFGYNRNTLRWSLLTSAGLGIAEIKMAVCSQGQYICAKQYLWYWDLGVGAWMKWMSSSISMIWIFFLNIAAKKTCLNYVEFSVLSLVVLYLQVQFPSMDSNFIINIFVLKI